MSLLDKAIGYFSPARGLNRAMARAKTAAVQNSYEAAETSRLRKKKGNSVGVNTLVQKSAIDLRNEARYLQRNHDLSRGALRVLVNNVIGPKGIGVEPQPRIAGTNEIHEEYAKALLELWREWQYKPEVTQMHTFSKVQRLMASSWIRDGEGFAQDIIGPALGLVHGTEVPYSLELFEAQFVPMYNDVNRRIKQGIELNAWGRPTAAWVHKTDPLDVMHLLSTNDLKRIPWANMFHVRQIDRIGQLRGISDFASVITRISDLKDYEESERIAAKIAASMSAYVKKGSPDQFGGSGGLGETNAQGEIEREIYFTPGMVFDDLRPGEEIGTIDTNRPNPNLVSWRQGQIKMFAAGLGGSYSSIARDYDGNYSAQRQEMIEQWVHYATLADEFVGMFVQPVWKRFVMAAELSGKVKRPPNLAPNTWDDALFVGQQMPWIDPLKEASAAEKLVNNRFTSHVDVIRRRGLNPNEVLSQTANFKKKADALGVSLGGNDNPTANEQGAQDGNS